MHKRLTSYFAVMLCIAITGCGRDARDSATGDAAADGSSHRRIVSMAPSLTEILFALGLGDRVVGVTDFCDYPPAAAARPKIGGYYDANYERIFRLEPTLVLVLTEHEEARAKFESLGIPYLEVSNRSVDGIIRSIQRIGKECGATEAAGALVANIRKRIAVVRDEAVAAPDKPRILISVGRAMGSGRIKDVYVAGAGTIFDELIRMAGGVNAYSGQLEYPTVGAEGILRMNPEIVIDLVADLERVNLTENEIRKEWQALAEIDAVKNDRIHVLTGDYATVPGPRFITLLEDISAAMHGK